MNIIKRFFVTLTHLLSFYWLIYTFCSSFYIAWLCNPSYWDGGIWGWHVEREPPKGSKWPAEGLHYTWGSTRGGAHTRVPPGADWIPICLGPRGCLVTSQAPGSHLGSCGVKIDPAKGSRNVCSVPGYEAKSLMGYPLPSFGKASIQTNKQIFINYLILASRA